MEAWDQVKAISPPTDGREDATDGRERRKEKGERGREREREREGGRGRGGKGWE
jgi:hypothetical protein